MTIPNWQSGTTYEANAVVLHNGEAYIKLADDDQSEPDHIEGGWALVPNSNAAEYNVIADAFNGYEARKAAHQKKIADALKAAGLTPGEVLVTLTAEEAAGEITR
jgi:hypothetical protein